MSPLLKVYWNLSTMAGEKSKPGFEAELMKVMWKFSTLAGQEGGLAPAGFVEIQSTRPKRRVLLGGEEQRGASPLPNLSFC